jgi:MFS family permease
LTLVETGVSPESLPQIAASFAVSAVSLAAFVAIERKIASPLLDLRLLKDRTLLPSYIILISTGISMFISYPSIVQLVRSPVPLGFGGDAIDAANVQLPFMVMFLIFASATALIISKIGSVKPTLIGAVVSLVGSIGLLMFHSTEFAVSANLAIIATGLSLTSTAVWNLIVSSAPKEFIGISTGVGALLLFVGMAIGPALAGVYMEDKETVEGIAESYPSPESYNLIFLTSGLLSAVSLGFALMLRKKLAGKPAAGA